jgi:hypothetical protein
LAKFRDEKKTHNEDYVLTCKVFGLDGWKITIPGDGEINEEEFYRIMKKTSFF